MARPPTPTQRSDWPIADCDTCVTGTAGAPISEVYTHLGAAHGAYQSAAFDLVLAERTAAQGQGLSWDNLESSSVLSSLSACT